jgi:FxsC-like protein
LPQFFLSRAPGDDDSYALRFFGDLSDKVREVTGTDGPVGFVDTVDTDGRSPWSAEAWHALSSCRVFVALCSPRYLLSERCGREWWVFAERLRRYERTTGEHAPALIPIVWSDGGGPGGSGDEEVRQLIRLRSLRPRYETFLDSLARRIVGSGERHDIPPSSPDLDPATVPNAFDQATAIGTRIQPPTPPSPADAATRRVHFVVAAGTRAEMGEVRDDVRFYGDHARDWQPYRPALSGPLVIHAQALAAGRLFDSEVAGLDGLAERVEHADHNNEIVVLLVDSWITKFSAYRRTLAEFDRDRPNGSGTAILAPTSAADGETLRHRSELRSELTDALRNHLTKREQLARIDIESPDSFGGSLVAVLEEAQNRIFSHGRVFRRPAGGQSTDRPILQGP